MSPAGASRLIVPNTSTGEEAFFAAWSPDGKTVYYVAKGPLGSSIRSVPVTGGTSRLLVRFDDPTRQHIRYGFSTDGRTFYCTIGDARKRHLGGATGGAVIRRAPKKMPTVATVGIAPPTGFAIWLRPHRTGFFVGVEGAAPGPQGGLAEAGGSPNQRRGQLLYQQKRPERAVQAYPGRTGHGARSDVATA